MSDLDDLDGLGGLTVRPGYRPVKGQGYDGLGATQALWRAQERQRRGKERRMGMISAAPPADGPDNSGLLANAIGKIDSGKYRILVAGGPAGDFPEALRRDERIRWWHTTEANERDAQRDVPIGTDVVLICKKITHKMAGRVSLSAKGAGALCSLKALTPGQITRLLQETLPERQTPPADNPPADAGHSDDEAQMSISRPGRLYTGTLAAFIAEKLKADPLMNDRELFDAAVGVGIQPQLTAVAEAASKARASLGIDPPAAEDTITDPAIRQAITSIDDAIAALQLARAEVIKIGVRAEQVSKTAAETADAAQKLANLKTLLATL